MDFKEVLYKRTSVRSFNDKEVSLEDLKEIATDAMKAASAMNKRPWEIYIVKNKDIVKQLINTSDRSRYNPNSIIVMCGNKNRFLDNSHRDFWIEDLSNATTNALLSAKNKNIDSVWIGVHPVEDRAANISKVLNLSSDIIPFSMIYLGYASEEPTPKNIDESEKIHIL
ncbi:MAG: nitroreductase family protein [Gammaproteobacteria bacterium]|nr:nitroreductase family protein [Gammaproteobacteria bacterium]